MLILPHTIAIFWRKKMLLFLRKRTPLWYKIACRHKFAYPKPTFGISTRNTRQGVRTSNPNGELKHDTRYKTVGDFFRQSLERKNAKFVQVS